MDVLIAMGVPSAIIGLVIWWFKRYLDKIERIREERESNTEKLILMILQDGRAAVVLAKATAKAVQRIPDAKCNGDVKAALEQAEKLQNEEQEFLLSQGIQHIFANK